MSDSTFEKLGMSEQMVLQDSITYEVELLDSDGYRGASYIAEKFKTPPLLTAGAGYGNPTGTAGDTNAMRIGENFFEYNIKGTQTILGPVQDANGLNIGMDQTDNDGVEITNGIHTRNRAAFNIDSQNCFFEVTLNVEDVSGTDRLCVGFRKAAAYAASVDDYTDAAFLDWNGTIWNISTILNDAATDTLETTLAMTDGATVTLKVEIIDGVTNFYYNGVDTGFTNVDFVFDAGEVVVPFLYLLNSSDLAGKVLLTKWRVGELIAR